MKVPVSWLKDFVDLPVEAGRLAQDLSLVGLEVGGLETHIRRDIAVDGPIEAGNGR